MISGDVTHGMAMACPVRTVLILIDVDGEPKIQMQSYMKRNIYLL